jgi:hypothetical protein
MQAALQGLHVAAGHGHRKSVQDVPQLAPKIGSEEKAGDRLSLVCPVSVAIRLRTGPRRPGDSDLSDIPVVGCRGVHLT